MTSPVGLTPGSPGAAASSATHARSSVSAPARQIPARSARPRATRSPTDVSAGVLGQVAQRADAVERLGPAGVLVIDRFRARESGATRWPGLDAATIDLVGHADPQRVDPGQDVELVEHDRADAVDRHRIAQRHGVEPADPPGSTGHGAEFVAALRDPLPDAVEQLGRIGPRADARRIRLHHADDLVDLERPDASTGARPARDRVRGRDVWITPVIEVEQRALRALEQDMLATCEGRLDKPGRVVQMVAQALAPPDGLVDERIDGEGLAAHRRQEEILVRQQPSEPLAEDLAIEQVFHAQAQPPRAIGVRRPDPAPGRPDSRGRQTRLVRLVQREVVRHDHVRTATHPDAGDVDAPLGQHVELGDQRQRVDHDTVADDRCDVRVQHAGRCQPQLEDLVTADDGVAGIVAALVAHDHGGLLGEEIGRLALALVAPLQPDDHGRRHQGIPANADASARRLDCVASARPSRGRRRASTRASALKVRERAAQPGNAPLGGDGRRPIKKAHNGPWVDCSRGAPPTCRRIAGGWSPDRLTGRPMRHSRAIVDLLFTGGPAAVEDGRSIAAGVRPSPIGGTTVGRTRYHRRVRVPRLRA